VERLIGGESDNILFNSFSFKLDQNKVASYLDYQLNIAILLEEKLDRLQKMHCHCHVCYLLKWFPWSECFVDLNQEMFVLATASHF